MIPPLPATLVGLLATLPFLGAAAMEMDLIGGDGRSLGVAAGTVVLAFLAGALWGFAARGAARWAYGLAALPALHLFLFVPAHPWGLPGPALSHLILGFIAVLVLDVVFQARRLAPRWWLTLRLPMTAATVTCLWVLRGA